MKNAEAENRKQFLQCDDFLNFFYHLAVLSIMKNSKSTKTISFYNM